MTIYVLKTCDTLYNGPDNIVDMFKTLAGAEKALQEFVEEHKDMVGIHTYIVQFELGE